MQVRRFAGVLNIALATLVLRGEAYVVGTSQLELQLSAASNTTAAGLRRLQPWKPTFQPSIAIFPGEELLAYWLDSLRWQAYSLAQALHQMQRSQPTEHHAAYAASQRRCAYLRCASLGGRAQYCSGCRVSRYCSRADQLADWRAGHRHACCMLVKFAAEEAAEQAQRQQARAEQQQAQLRQQAQQAEQQRQAQQAQRAQQPHWLRRKQQRRRR